VAETGRTRLRRALRVEEHGGSGLTRLDATLVFEALARSCASVAAFLSIHNMCARMLESYADDALRDRLLPPALGWRSSSPTA
jgi:alkylation response protein AidB-like acyl-CoA dehydrogenase